MMLLFVVVDADDGVVDVAVVDVVAFVVVDVVGCCWLLLVVVGCCWLVVLFVDKRIKRR